MVMSIGLRQVCAVLLEGEHEGRLQAAQRVQNAGEDEHPDMAMVARFLQSVPH